MSEKTILKDNEIDLAKETKNKTKRFFWIKLKEGFFEDKYIRIIKKLPNGYRTLVIYLSMQLKALKTDGLIAYEQLLPSYTDELAWLLGEDEEAVNEALHTLEKFNLIEVWDDKTVYLTAKQELIAVGSESESAERVRRCRAKKRALQCNDI